MSLPTSRLAYADCFDAFNKAMAKRTGIRIQMADQDAALYYRMRMNYARTIDRQENAKTYERGHPMHGCSAYDPIIIKIRPEADEEGNLTGIWWMYLEKHETIPGIVESLDEDEDDTTTPVAPESNPRPDHRAVPQSVDLGNWDEDQGAGGREGHDEGEGADLRDSADGPKI